MQYNTCYVTIILLSGELYNNDIVLLLVGVHYMCVCVCNIFSNSLTYLNIPEKNNKYLLKYFTSHYKPALKLYLYCVYCR